MSRRGLLLVAVLALLTRVGFEWSLRHDAGPAGALAGRLLGDERAYDRQAREIAAGTAERTRAFYQAPLYPWLLGQLDKLWPPPEPAGDPAVIAPAPVHEAVFALQHLLGIVACLLTAGLGARVLDRRAGLLAGLMAALSGPLLFHESMLLKASLSLVVLLVSLHLWLDVLGGARRRRVVALGLALGCGVLLRGNLFLLLGAVIVSLLWPLGSARRRWTDAAFVLVTALAALSPVTLHNLRRGDLVLSTYQSGSNAAIGNPAGDDPHQGLVYSPLRAGRGDAWFEERDAVAIAEQAAGRTLTGREVSQWWWSQVRARVAEHPGTALQRAAWKAVHLFHRAEVPDVKDWFFLVRAAPWLGTPLSDLLVLGPLALLGLLLLPWRRRPGLTVVRGGLAVIGLSLVVFYVMGRYRLPALPCLWILAAGQLERWGALWSGRRGRLALEAALVAVLVALQLAVPLPSDSQGDHVSWANAASVRLADAESATDAEAASAARDEAVDWARHAVQIAPAFPAARRILARALSAASPVLEPRRQEAWDAAWRLLLLMEGLRTGREPLAGLLDGPLQSVRDEALALLDVPSAPGGDVFAGPLLAWAARGVAQELRQGDAERQLALRLIDHALLFDADEPLAHVQRGLFLKRLGRLAEAETSYRRALALGGDSVELHNNLGSVLLELGRFDEAEVSFVEAQRLAPDDPRVRANLERARAALR